MCSLVPYHLCFAKLYCGYFLCILLTISLSLWVLAMIEAMEIFLFFWSHLTMVVSLLSRSFSSQNVCFPSIIISILDRSRLCVFANFLIHFLMA